MPLRFEDVYYEFDVALVLRIAFRGRRSVVFCTRDMGHVNRNISVLFIS